MSRDVEDIPEMIADVAFADSSYADAQIRHLPMGDRTQLWGCGEVTPLADGHHPGASPITTVLMVAPGCH